MKLINILTFSILLSSCSNSKSGEIDYIKNKELILENNAIFISCFKCDCVLDYLENRDKEFFKKFNIKLFSDSTCSNSINRIDGIQFFPQSSLDSILLKNYNAVLLKKRNGKAFYKILETENSNKFASIVRNFFEH